MTVTSRIYAQLENKETIYHIANIEYEEGEFGAITLLDDGVRMVAASILDLLRQVEGFKQELKDEQLHGAAQGKQANSHPGPGNIQ